MTKTDGKRILMLVPHEPKLDPRVGWVIGICRQLARTEVIAATWSSAEPATEYDGVVSIDRFNVSDNAARLALRLLPFANRIGASTVREEFVQRAGKPPRRRALKRRLRHHAGGAARWFADWVSYSLLVTSLYRRARAVSVRPDVVIAHDIYGLIPAALLKRRWRAPVLYDSHEYAAHGDLLAPAWHVRLTRWIEGACLRRVDRVITVSPPLARQLERDYALEDVVSVPNAEPAALALSREIRPPSDGIVRFLVQGQLAAGRGFERLFDLWGQLEDPRARLLIRCPDGAYPTELRQHFHDLFDSGTAEWLEPVTEDELVDAASAAEVGVIPYLGPNLNHVYACPNKLSQYMAAGLAILSTDLMYVRSVIDRYSCGVVYDPHDVSTFRQAIGGLLDDPNALDRMRRNALAAAQGDYNWEHVSIPYRDAILGLLGNPS